jgi:hypothetical protein
MCATLSLTGAALCTASRRYILSIVHVNELLSAFTLASHKQQLCAVFSHAAAASLRHNRYVIALSTGRCYAQSTGGLLT